MPTAQRDPQLLKGVLPMLVLTLLAEQESYGYELVTRLQADGLTDIATGTVYPVLARLERDALVETRLVQSSSGPARRYYQPTTAGLASLTQARTSWSEFSDVVATLLTRTSPAVRPDAPTEALR